MRIGNDIKRRPLMITTVALLGVAGAFSACSDGQTSSTETYESVEILPTPEVDNLDVAPLPQPLTMTNFSSTGNSTAVMLLDRPVKKATLTHVNSGNSRPLSSNSDGLQIEFFEDTADGDGQFDEDIYIFEAEADGPVRIELVRHSPSELLEGLGSDVPRGNTILGPHTLDFSAGDTMFSVAHDPDYGFAVELPDDLDSSTGLSELDLAARVTKALNGRPMTRFANHLGPYGSLKEELDALARGDGGVNSVHFRDMWTHAAIAHGLEVRTIGLVSYAPSFPDLIPYSHVMVEVMTADGWKAVDPWFNSVFMADGNYLSASEVRDMMRTDASAVEIVPLIPDLETQILGSDGSITPTRVNPPTQRAYLNYFNAILTLELEAG